MSEIIFLCGAHCAGKTSILKALTRMHVRDGWEFELRVSHENIFARTKTFNQNRSWAADFYTKIDSAMTNCLKELGLENKVVELDANRDFDSVVADVKRAIECF